MSKPAVINNRFQIAHRSSWLFIARVMPTLVFIITTILYSRKLSYHDYGLFQSIWLYTNIIAVTLCFGIHNILLSTNLSAFFAYFNSNRSKIINFYFGLAVIVFSVFLLTAQIMSVTLRLLLIAFVLLQIVTIILEAILINIRKERIIFITNLFYSLIFFGWHFYLLFYSSFNLEWLVSGIIIIGAARIFIFFLNAKNISFPQTNSKINLKQWAFIGFNDVVGVFAKWIDKLILIYLITPTEFAIFFNGSIEIPVFGILISVIGSIMLVEIATKINLKNEVAKIFKESFLLLACIVFPFFWFLLFNRSELFFLAFGNKYDASIPIFLITLLIIPLRINHYGAVLQCYNKSNIVLIGSVLDILIALALMPILYYFLGVKGIALSIVISTYFQCFYYIIQSAKVLQIPVFQLVPIKSLLLQFLLMFIIYLILSYTTQSLELLTRLVIATLLTFVIITINLLIYFKKERLFSRKISALN